MNIKNNKRSQDTEARVETIFLHLLTQKHISKITVRELCEGAQITRTSFYGHYQDVYDLLDKVQTRITTQVVRAFQSEWNKNSRDIHVAFVQTFRSIEENRDFFMYFLKNADMKSVFSSGQVAGLFEKELSKQEMMYVKFFVGGLNALLIDWLEGGCVETPEELLAVMPEIRPLTEIRPLR